MSGSASDSSDAEEVMIVRLADIRTIGQAFQSGVLKAAAKQRHAPNAACLDQISLFQGDITGLQVDSIVNAANRSLLGGGGVDGAIHAAAGPELYEECKGLGGCETGESKITAAYKLPSKHIIHTVGPVYSRGDVETRAQQLESCYRTSLNLAIENSLKHIAFPSISTGIYGYPIEAATHIALDLVRRFCDSDVGSKLDRVIFVVWSNKDKEVYETLIPEYFPCPESSQEPPPGDGPTTDDPSAKTTEPPLEAPVSEQPPPSSVAVETEPATQAAETKAPKAP
ncbi:hypothetical protein DFH07DRAFT_861946 [Mycena maculata]|uniref:Macro domain-containing protein n=1 Tax=Mycena maculata TaxID=230809 RepID=A0AAD7HB41_9AGAR|nr:hypothetical protein DFH07DRAFT_861946 [Mycena maculata]